MNELILIITGGIASLSTYIVSTRYKQGAVRASALLSLVVGIIFLIFPNLTNEYLQKAIPVVFIGASFAGMTAPTVISNKMFITVSGFLFSIIYLNASKFFTGYGGGLGTTACISVFVSFGINYLITKFPRPALEKNPVK